ncbi:hypothetical protein CFC21_095881 [Triticum aestivum]|uniref:Uncharacterized protein n=4 Tax=Triticum TaxID=4564 RepID=A0A9R1BIJ8_TRITD|nr:hypothetical protein TRIUR3_18709 [Triticum urartu]KAF7093471.1 hypothetical protein CFC21_095881 [Triticum aestivum]VAI69909.1 unnamed protein product [Triticum turgidum subsp. durum]
MLVVAAAAVVVGTHGGVNKGVPTDVCLGSGAYMPRILRAAGEQFFAVPASTSLSVRPRSICTTFCP